MAAISLAEIISGLVVHLDTSILRSVGGSSTNAELKNGIDRAVVGPHYFLALNTLESGVLAVPLFSKEAPGSILLQEHLKAGEPVHWIGEDSYCSKWQHWRIPSHAIVSASGDDESTVHTRRTYAAGQQLRLNFLAHWAVKNRASWRSI